MSPGLLSGAVRKPRSAWLLYRTFGASTDLTILYPYGRAKYYRLFEAGSKVVANLVLRSSGRRTRREAPAGSSHARKRAVSRDKQNRGLEGQHIDTERLFHSFSAPASGGLICVLKVAGRRLPRFPAAITTPLAIPATSLLHPGPCRFALRTTPGRANTGGANSQGTCFSPGIALRLTVSLMSLRDRTMSLIEQPYCERFCRGAASHALGCLCVNALWLQTRMVHLNSRRNSRDGII